MDFIFEDEVDEVGSDVEAYCPKCKADTTHVVISKYEDEIRRVQCNPCGDVHSFRKPRGETEDDVPEPVAARKRALLKKPGWAEFFTKKNPNDARPYEFREQYRENIIVSHPKFGVGFVSEVVSDSKVEITFEDARRILVHNRRDIPALPLAAEGDGVPTPPRSAAKPAKPAKAAKADKATKAEAAKAELEVTAAKKPAKGGASAAAEAAPEPKAPARAGGAKAEKAASKPEAPAKEAPTKKEAKPDLKLVKPAAKAPAAKAAKAPAKPAAAAKTAAPAKAAAPAKVGKAGKGGKALSAKSPGKAGKAAAAPRGSKTASKPAAKKPAPKPKKKAGKKR